jgi:hypothetical protein
MCKSANLLLNIVQREGRSQVCFGMSLISTLGVYSLVSPSGPLGLLELIIVTELHANLIPISS